MKAVFYRERLEQIENKHESLENNQSSLKNFFSKIKMKNEYAHNNIWNIQEFDTRVKAELTSKWYKQEYLNDLNYYKKALLIEYIKYSTKIDNRNDWEFTKIWNKFSNPKTLTTLNERRFLQAFLYINGHYKNVTWSAQDICSICDWKIGKYSKLAEWNYRNPNLTQNNWPTMKDSLLSSKNQWITSSNSNDIHIQNNNSFQIKDDVSISETQEEFKKKWELWKAFDCFMYLKQKLGMLKEHQIRWIIWNIYWESWFDTTIRSDGWKWACYYLCQWTWSRKLALEKKAWKSLFNYKVQLDFLVEELKSDYFKSTLHWLSQSSNINEATYIFQQKFEKTAVKTMHEKRANFASICNELQQEGKLHEAISKWIDYTAFEHQYFYWDSWISWFRDKKNRVCLAGKESSAIVKSISNNKWLWWKTVVVHMGINDRNNHKWDKDTKRLDVFQKNCEKLINDAKKDGYKVILCEIAPKEKDQNSAKINEIIKWCWALGTINLEEKISSLWLPYQTDGLHLTKPWNLNDIVRLEALMKLI